jgi:hypothetical protein
LLPSAESLGLRKCVADAQREFLRIAEVTDRISEHKTCLCDTRRRVIEGVFGKTTVVEYLVCRRVFDNVLT